MFDDYGNYVGDDTMDYPWVDNGDGSMTDPNSGEIWQNGEVIGYDVGDGSGNWIDLQNIVYDAAGNPIGTETEQGFEPYNDPLAVNTPQDWTGYTDNGDGTHTDAAGTIYDDRGEAIGYDPSVAQKVEGSPTQPIAPQSGGFLSGVKSFFSGLFGGSGSSSGAGSGSGGSFGGMSSSAQQKANQAAQQLRAAQQMGANPSQIAALQNQLVQAMNEARNPPVSPFLIAAGVGLGVYALTRDRK